MKDRNDAYNQVMKLRDEYDFRMSELSNQLKILSKQHLFNMKEYLQYRRDSKQLIVNLKLQTLKSKSDKMKTERNCKKAIKKTLYESKKFEQKLGNETQTVLNSFRRQTMEKDCQIQMMREQLKENKDSFMYKLSNMKEKLATLHKKNKNISKQRQYDKDGFASDIKQLRIKMKNLDSWITMESAAGEMSLTLRNQVEQMQKRIDELTASIDK